MSKVAIFFYIDDQHGNIKLGGAERRLARIFDELTFCGFDTQLILKVKKQSEHVRHMFEEVLEHKKVKILQFVSYVKMMKYMKTQRFVWICYTDSYKAMIPFLISGLLFGSKRMMLNVTTYTSQLKFNNRSQKLLFDLVVKLSNHLDVLYPTGINCLKKKYPTKKITLTPGAFTDLELFKPKEKMKKIVFLASLINNKNPELLVDSVYMVKDELENYNYLAEICGTGPLYDRIKGQIEEYKCEKTIKMSGYIKPQNVLPQAEIFISIQNYNNYPSQALLEAISSGCYIIASNEGDTKRIVKNSFGVLCELTPESIGLEILNYIKKDEKEKQMIIDSAREFALSEFRIEKSVEHYDKLFRL